MTTDSYDNNGNTTASSGISFTYDFENRLLMKGAVINVYDGDGNRVSETAAGTTTSYLVDTLNPGGYSQVMDELVSGAVTRTYTFGLQRISENQLISGAWKPSFYGYDGHGNVRFLGNTAGTVTDTYQFDAFGNLIVSTGTTPNTYLYSGERFDSNLNLYHLRARYYNLLTGRFMTTDPWPHEGCSASRLNAPWGLNSYGYADDDPVDRIDPTGRAAAGEYAVDLTPLIRVVQLGGIYYLGRAISQCAGSASDYIKCLNQYLVDLGNCQAAYPNDPVALANCYKAAKTKFDYCVLTSRGPCQ